MERKPGNIQDPKLAAALGPIETLRRTGLATAKTCYTTASCAKIISRSLIRNRVDLDDGIAPGCKLFFTSSIP